MKNNEKCLIRLKNILKQDKQNLPQPFINMVKTDVYALLNNYINICPGDVFLTCFIDEQGYYNFNITAKSKHIKKINFFNI